MSELPVQLNMDGSADPARPTPKTWFSMSNQERLKWLLEDCRWHNWRELQRVAGARFGGRIFELRCLGYRIEREFRGHDVFYRMPDRIREATEAGL